MNSSWARVSLCFVICGWLAAPARGAERPHVVVFLVDDLGCMDLGTYNPSTFYETPRIDQLASEGMRFTNSYSASPVCSPTRYSLMTGKYPTRAAVTNYFTGTRAGRFQPAPFSDRMELEESTLAEVLASGGYATFFAGKWHLGPTEEFWPEAQGFDVNRGGTDRGGPYGGGQYFSPYGNPRLTDGPTGEHLPDRLARETVAFLRQHTEEPCFCYLAFYSVHTPLMGPPDLVAKYETKSTQVSGPEFDAEEQVWPTDEPRRVRIVQKHAVYAAMVEAMDRAVGTVLDGLDELGIADDTVVVFTSDNGGLSTSEGSPTANVPFRGGKGWIYEGGIRVPLIVRWPGETPAGTICETPVLSIDLFPTLAEIGGISPTLDRFPTDGFSLTALLRQAGDIPERPLFWHYPHYSNQGGFPGGAVRIGDWKLIERFEDGQLQLYNLREDVGEQQDLAEKFPERVLSLRDDLHAWYAETGARFLEPASRDGPMPWRP
jgi:arylsulfatase A-like enzyme